MQDNAHGPVLSPYQRLSLNYSQLSHHFCQDNVPHASFLTCASGYDLGRLFIAWRKYVICGLDGVME